MPEHYRPDLTDNTLAELLLVDENGRRVRVLVWRKGVENHGLAVGFKEPFIDANRDTVLLEVLDRLIAEASEIYDRLGTRPQVIELRGEGL